MRRYHSHICPLKTRLQPEATSWPGAVALSLDMTANTSGEFILLEFIKPIFYKWLCAGVDESSETDLHGTFVALKPKQEAKRS